MKQWFTNKSFPIHSGGTAPDFHRFSFYLAKNWQNTYLLRLI